MTKDKFAMVLIFFFICSSIWGVYRTGRVRFELGTCEAALAHEREVADARVEEAWLGETSPLDDCRWCLDELRSLEKECKRRDDIEGICDYQPCSLEDVIACEYQFTETHYDLIDCEHRLLECTKGGE